MDSQKNDTIVFEISATFPELLIQAIEHLNKSEETDFKLIEIIEDEITYCKISVSSYKISDIYMLGYIHAAIQYDLRNKGEIDW